MVIRVGINGFGRIGRLVLRVAQTRKDILVVAINDLPTNLNQYIHFFNRDTTYGIAEHRLRACKDDNGNEALTYDNHPECIRIHHCRDPLDIPWADARVDVVAECTGFFTKQADAAKHISGAKPARKVVISAPSPDAPMYVMGVNSDSYKSDQKIISNASCTTNCLAPLVKALDEEFGIECGLMTTVHATTGTQHTVDTMGSKFSLGASCFNNIIPSTTGAAKAVGKVYPAVSGKLTGMAMRVPTITGSVVDLKFVPKRKVKSAEEVNEAVMKATQSESLKGILGVSPELETVSSDVIKSSLSSMFDPKQTCVIGDGSLVQVLSWYDNEWGYTNRLLDMIQLAADE